MMYRTILLAVNNVCVYTDVYICTYMRIYKRIYIIAEVQIRDVCDLSKEFFPRGKTLGNKKTIIFYNYDFFTNCAIGKKSRVDELNE